jgi:hypothetical protein
MFACVQLGDSVDPRNYTAEDADQYAQLILCLDRVQSNTNDRENLATLQEMYGIVSSMMSEPNGCKEIIAMCVLRQGAQKLVSPKCLPDAIAESIRKFARQLGVAYGLFSSTCRTDKSRYSYGPTNENASGVKRPGEPGDRDDSQDAKKARRF